MNDSLLQISGGREKNSCSNFWHNNSKIIFKYKNQNIEKIVRKSLLQTISNKVNAASMTTRGQEENIDLITIVNFVEQALATLSKYRQQ